MSGLTPEQRAKMEAYGAIATPPKWISVDERMPEFERGTGYVMVAMSSGLVEKSLYCSDPTYFNTRSGLDAISNHFEHAAKYGYKVTHWMPLPEPPK